MEGDHILLNAITSEIVSSDIEGDHIPLNVNTSEIVELNDGEVLQADLLEDEAGDVLQTNLLEDEAATEEVHEQGNIYKVVGAILTGFLVGYGSSLPGLLTSMNDFLKYADGDILEKKMHADTTTYCVFTSWKVVVLTLPTPVFACIMRVVAVQLCDMWGSRTMLLGSYTIAFGGALASLFSFGSYIAGSILSGIGLRAASMVVQIHLQETSSATYRSVLDRAYSYSVFVGVLATSLLSAVLSNKYMKGWRILVGFGAVIAFVLLVSSCLLRIPNIKRINSHGGQLWRRKYRPWVILSFVYQAYNVLAGAMLISFFMPIMYEMLGFPREKYFVYPTVFFVVTIIGWIVSNFVPLGIGRKCYMLISAALMACCQFMITLFVTDVRGPEYETDIGLIYGILVFMSIFVLVYTSTFGPINWMEATFPDEVKWFGVSISASFNSLVSVLLAFMINIMFCHLRVVVFIIGTIINLLMTIFIYFFLPQTEGIPTEEMEEIIWRPHWFWRRYMVEV